jgi:DNA-binding response OmpR family regulator
VVDDESSIRELVGAYLQKEGFKVRCFPGGAEFQKAFAEMRPDLVVLDIMMPGCDGMALSSYVRASGNIPIVIISAKRGEWDKIAALNLGCNDYLVKPFSVAELTARVKNLIRFCGNIVPKDAVFEDIRLLAGERDVRIGGQVAALSPLEYNFLAFLLEKPQHAVSRGDLLRHVWHTEQEVDSRCPSY